MNEKSVKNLCMYCNEKFDHHERDVICPSCRANQTEGICVICQCNLDAEETLSYHSGVCEEKFNTWIHHQRPRDWDWVQGEDYGKWHEWEPQPTHWEGEPLPPLTKD